VYEPLILAEINRNLRNNNFLCWPLSASRQEGFWAKKSPPFLAGLVFTG
jgi:hypothetical protein